jgi:uncharacterized membrane protein
MRWKTKSPLGRFTLRETVDIHQDVACVFACWNRFEEFPRFMESVRRTKRIDERRVLWDIDIAGRQVVCEAHIVESIPAKLIRWESSWGAGNSGEVRFEALPNERTRLTVAMEFRPQKLLDRLGALFGVVDDHVHRDLERFRGFVEKLPGDELDEWRCQR